MLVTSSPGFEFQGIQFEHVLLSWSGYVYAFSFKDHLPVKDNMTDEFCLSYNLVVCNLTNKSLYINHRGHMSLGSAQVCLGLSFMNWRVEMALISQSCDRYAYFLQQFWKMLAKFLPARMCMLLKYLLEDIHSFSFFNSFFTFLSKNCMGPLFCFCFYI